MVRIQWKLIAAISLLLTLALTAVRGCRLARKNAALPGTGQASGFSDSAPDGSLAVSVYDHRENTVKDVPLETYLVGVVAAEMPVSFHPEALKAQAVAARTYTLRKMERGGCKRHDADICTDSSCCQAYLSDARMLERWGDAALTNRKTTMDAVAATSGEVLTYGGELIEALYHSASGGQTEASADAFTFAQPYLVSVMSTNESGISGLSETVPYSTERFIARVKESHPNANLSAQKLDSQIEILKTSASGRVLELRLGSAILTGRQARSLFGLKSTLFTIGLRADEVVFSVRGYGHGVGMSQTGANGMGLGGATYREILEYYYRGVTIERADAR